MVIARRIGKTFGIQDLEFADSETRRQRGSRFDGRRLNAPLDATEVAGIDTDVLRYLLDRQVQPFTGESKRSFAINGHITAPNMRNTHIKRPPKFAQRALRGTHNERDHAAMRELVGSNIRRIRKAKGWTILELATAIESDVGNVSRLERGKQGFSDAILMKIASIFRVDVMELFKGQDGQESSAAIEVDEHAPRSADERVILKICHALPKPDVAMIRGYAEGKFRERFPDHENTRPK